MHPSLNIRPATPQDVPLIRSLIAGLAEFEKLEHEMKATEEGLRKTLFEGRPVAEVLIAEWEGKGVGFALYFFSYSTFLAKPGIYLEDLFVFPAYRSHGIGKELLRSIAKVAEARNYGRVEWSCLDWNERALKFYRSLGAEPMGDWTVQRLTEEKFRRLARGEV